MSIGIEHLKSLVMHSLSAYDLIRTAQADGGGINWRDFFTLKNAAKEAALGYEDIKSVLPELKDLQEDEAQQLIEMVQAHLNIPSLRAKRITEAVLRALPYDIDVWAEIDHPSPVATPV